MLVFLRNKSNQKKIFLPLAILIIPSFLAFGIVAENQGGDALAGRIAGQKISTGEFLRHYEAVRREMFLLRGMDPRSVEGRVDFEKLTWDRALLLGYAKRAGVKASDKEVLAWIGEQAAFSPTGKFSPELYKVFVERQLRLTPREFEEEIRDFLTLQKAVARLVPEKNITDEEARLIYVERHAPRDLQYIIVAATEADKTDVSEEEIKKLYETFGKMLTTAEERKIRFVAIPKASPQDTPEIKAALAGGLSSLPSGVESKETDFLKKGDAFPEIGYMQPLSEAIFALQAGGRTDWIENDKYSTIAELIDIKKSEPATYEQAAPNLRQRIEQSEAGRKMYDRALNLRKAMTDQGFEGAAQKENVPLLESKNFKRADHLDKAGIITGFDTSIAPLAAGQISEPVETTGGYVIAKVLSIGQTDSADFEKEKPAIVEELQNAGRSEAYTAEMAKLWAKLEPNVSTMSTIFPDKYKETIPPASPASAELAQ